MSNGQPAAGGAHGEVVRYMEIPSGIEEEEAAISRKAVLADALGKEGLLTELALTPFDWYESPIGEIKEQSAFSPHYHFHKWDVPSVFTSFLAPFIGLALGCFSKPKGVETYVNRIKKHNEIMGAMIQNIYAAELKGLQNADLEQKQKETELEEGYKALVDAFGKMDEKYQRMFKEQDEKYQRMFKDLAKEIEKAKAPQPYFGAAPPAPWYRATQPCGGYPGGTPGPIDLNEVEKRLNKIEERQQEYEAHLAVKEGK